MLYDAARDEGCWEPLALQAWSLNSSSMKSSLFLHSTNEACASNIHISIARKYIELVRHNASHRLLQSRVAEVARMPAPQHRAVSRLKINTHNSILLTRKKIMVCKTTQSQTLLTARRAPTSAPSPVQRAEEFASSRLQIILSHACKTHAVRMFLLSLT